MQRLNIGAIIYPDMDQADFTGPLEVLSRIPNARFLVIGRHRNTIRDVRGLILTPETTFSESPQLDVLIIPGGVGQEELLNDEVTLSFIRKQSETARYVLSVCTGALLCGAVGLLNGVKATTHWAAFDVLHYFGAIPVNSRDVIDGKYVTTVGVTAGLDGSFRLASLLCGDDVAQEIQLSMEYAPEPPFDAGSPFTAPSDVVDRVRNSFHRIASQRLITARQVASRLGIHPVGMGQSPING